MLLRKKPYLLFSAFLLAAFYCFGQLQAFQVIAPDKKTAQGKTTAQIEPFASFQRKIPGDSKPIRVDADSISSWLQLNHIARTDPQLLAHLQERFGTLGTS